MARVELASLPNGTLWGELPDHTVQLLSGARAYIYTHGTTDEATVYAAETGSSTLTQPLTLDEESQLPGWCDAPQKADVVYVVNSVAQDPVTIDVYAGDELAADEAAETANAAAIAAETARAEGVEASTVRVDSGPAPQLDGATVRVDRNVLYYDATSGKIKGKAISGGSDSAPTVSERIAVVNGGANLRNGLTSNNWFVPGAGGTSRIAYWVPSGVSDIRLLFVNDDDPNDAPFPNPILVAASIDQGGVRVEATFLGQRQMEIAPNGYAWTDPIPVRLVPGKWMYVNTFVAPAGSPNYFPCWPVPQYQSLPSPPPVANHNYADPPVDLTAPGADPTTITGRVSDGVLLFQAAAITGISDEGLGVGLVGDSIQEGYQNTSPNTSTDTAGYGDLALNGALPCIKLAVSGDQLGALEDFTHEPLALEQLRYCDAIFFEYPTNDIYTFGNLTYVQTRAILAWQGCAERGQRVVQSTILPKTTSTDGWTTEENQTPESAESVRVAFNTWIRAGAPINKASLETPNPVAVPAGSHGAITAGQPGHPLGEWEEVADLVESARNSGIWAVSGGVAPTPDGVHPSPAKYQQIGAAVGPTLRAKLLGVTPPTLSAYDQAVVGDLAEYYWPQSDDGSEGAALELGGRAPLIYVGGVTPSSTGPGDGDQALGLDGATGYLQNPAIPWPLSDGSDRPTTLECVIKPSSMGGTIIANYSANDQVSIGGDYVAFTIAGTNALWHTGNLTGAWHHLVFTYDPTTGHCECFLDGTSLGVVTNSGVPSTDGGLVAGWNNGYGSFLSGEMAKLAIYRSILSSTRIAAHHAAL